MSLINDMLKDLEARRAEKTAPEDKSLAGLKSVKHDKNKSGKFKRPFVSFLLLVLAIVLLVTFVVSKPWLYKISKVRDQKAPVQKTTEQPIKAALPETVLLKKITTVPSESQMLLQLDLTHPAHHQLHFSDNRQTLILALSNTQLGEPLSSIQNTFVKDSRFVKVDNDLFLILEVMPLTEVKDITISEKEPFTLNMILVNPKISPLGEQPGIEPVIEKVDVLPSPQQLAERSYKQALEFIDQNDFKQAEIELQKSLKQVPNFIPARRTLATLLINQRRYRAAKMLLYDGLQYTPDSIDLIKLYAQLLIRQEQLRKALLILQRVSPNLEEDPSYYALVAALRQRLGEPLIAAQLYEQLLKYDANNGVWWLGLGIALESSGKQNEALDAYKHAVATGKLTPDVQAYVKGKLLQGS